ASEVAAVGDADAEVAERASEDVLCHRKSMRPRQICRGPMTCVVSRGYGSTRTMVGLGIPVAPLYATLPRYFVPGVRPENVRLIAPDVPNVALAGALTVMFPAP